MGLGSGDKVSANVDFQPWCNADFSNCTYGLPTTIAMQVSSSPAEVGEVVTMDTLVTADDVYGMQLNVQFDATKLEFQAPPASSHNDVAAAGWYWDILGENFKPLPGGGTAVGLDAGPAACQSRHADRPECRHLEIQVSEGRYLHSDL